MYGHSPIARRAIVILLSIVLGSCPLWSTGSLAQHDPAAASNASVSNTANAQQLVDAIKDSVVLIIQSTRSSSDPRLARDSAPAQPFWSALKQLNEASDRLERGFFMRDKTFTTAIGDTLSSVVQTDIAFANLNVQAPQVKHAIGKTRQVIDALADNYGELAQRLRRGGALSAAEHRQLEALRAKQSELDAQLDNMKKQLIKEKKKNKKALQGIERLKKEVAKSKQRTRNNTPGAFAGGVFAGHILSGMCWGWHWWWGPWWGAWGPVFIVDYSYVYVDAIDVIDVEMDWDLLEQAIALDQYDFALNDFDQAEVIADTMEEYLADAVSDDSASDIEDGIADTRDAGAADQWDDRTGVAEEHDSAGGHGKSDIDTDTGGYDAMEDRPAYEPSIDAIPDAGMDDMGDFDDGGFDDFY